MRNIGFQESMQYRGRHFKYLPHFDNLEVGGVFLGEAALAALRVATGIFD